MDKHYTLQTAATGEAPAQWLGTQYGGRSGYTLADWAHSGNMDAPWFIPAGSLTNNNCDAVPATRMTVRGV